MASYMPYPRHANMDMQEDLFSRLPLEKRRVLVRKKKSDQPASAAATAAAAYVGAGSEIQMDIILRRDREGAIPGCRRVLFALLEKGLVFQEVFAEASEVAPLPELVLGDTLVHGWENCLLSLEETVFNVPRAIHLIYNVYDMQ